MKLKIIFVFDDLNMVIATPEELQLRQVEQNCSALGIPGKNEQGEDTFFSLVKYPVNLVAIEESSGV